MRKGYFLLLLACLFAIPTFGVPSHDNYIAQDDVLGSWMHSYYGSWTPGAPPTGGAENENFFIGRVRPLKRFTNTATQVINDGSETIRANRGLLWWVPIGENDNGSWTSLPSYSFESEAFSMWSYITIYGNWTQGFLRQPGAFADACHKNGVKTACVSAAPWAVALSSTDKGHGQNYQALIDGGYEKLMKLFRYYGIDGLGFNSEQTWGMRDGMKTLLANCHTYKGDFDGLGDRLHFDFYQLSDVLSRPTSGGGTDWSDFFPNANGFFLNYNWGSGQLNTSTTAAAERGGSSYDVYAGMDQQGRSSADWQSLNNYPISVGIWGAHNKNMIWQGSISDGSAPLAIQNCYLRKCEQFFTGGTQNPVNDIAITNELCTGNAGFFGVSKLVAAKSALSWTTNNYFPFISYLNLGVGKFFNNEGETTFDSEWYNIGMQDHLPTWRWWITDEYMARSTSNVPSDTHASFTYEDAWFGGSCLKLTFDNSVSSGFRYIQLFKTQFPIEDANYTMRVRYK
ncbi:MAG: secretion protein Por, partial [Paludibacteraceae bacterium]